MASSEMVHVLEHCRIAPPPGSVDGKSLSLTFFDLPWLHFPLMKLFFFYEFSHPKTYFVETIIPRLKHSLSLTLKHFFPLSGNLIFPLDCSIPEIRYKDGDSVSLTFVEGSFDFDHLSGNHQRNDIDFHPLAVQMSPASTTFGPLIVPLLAIQDCGQGSNWAPLNLLELFGKVKFEGCQSQLSTNNVRATFLLRRAEVQRLKKWVIPQIPKQSHVSAFTVICAYVWSCMIKARSRSGEDVGENELEHFAFTADCRTLLDPPIPAAYFGNCLMGGLATTKSTRLIQEDGFIVAAKSIREAIHERVRNKGGVLKGVQQWVSDLKSLNRMRMAAVVGSPRFQVIMWILGSVDLRNMKSYHEIDTLHLMVAKIMRKI
ncbi:Anthocyanin 5-aromatic acyltransferase [Vitis vinifera]|uniref:Anthocyanin 5-aromatic acyltransferase n=1 Tax=Vitis vinifera TaxID=29760 RepID=A0A438IEF9_VITVI|nr:Anthocyanin 5-aromatic acyltransferase [Vitis vinifera]